MDKEPIPSVLGSLSNTIEYHHDYNAFGTHTHIHIKIHWILNPNEFKYFSVNTDVAKRWTEY